MTAMIAGWERLAVDARYLMHLSVVWVVDNFVNPGVGDLLSWLEFVALISHRNASRLL